MKSLLLAVLLLQTNPQAVGTVTGVVHGPGGAPAVGVRVYAVAVRETPDASAATAPLEGLAQTDASGRYRLEVSPGRYYIASGSVSAPTYHPGTRDIQSARVVTVASGSVTEAIDFSSFVPAVSQPFGLPSGTGVLSGVLRFPDGTPAAGVAVSAALASAVSSGSVPASPPLQIIQIPTGAQFTLVSSIYRVSMTQNNGQYVIQGLVPGTYYVAAGTNESPTLYPGVTDRAKAKTLVTTPTTNLTSLDFTVPKPPNTTSVSGVVTALGGASAAGATVEIKYAAASVSPYGLPASAPPRSVRVGPDGRFELTGVAPGIYTLDAWSGGVRAKRNITVADQPLRDLEISIAAIALSGSVVGENGSAFEDPRVFSDAIVTTVSNPNIITSTIMPITKEGKFARIIEPEEYRFYLRTLPEEYTIQSMTGGGVDLLKETLKVTGKESIDVEVRVAKRTTAPDAARISVRGRAIDSLTGDPSAATRVTLCCQESGAAQRFSAPLNPDGTFAFTDVRGGHYDVGFEVKDGLPNLFPVGEGLDIGTQSLSDLTIKTTPKFGELAAAIQIEGGNPVPSNSSMAVVFTSTKGLVRVVAPRSPNGTYIAALPVGDRYTLSVTNLPDGYVVKSIQGSTEVTPVNYPAIGAPPPLVPIVITIGPLPR